MKKDSFNEYKEKRDFNKTTEPEGKKKKSSGKSRFVIQQHDASSLHYDFRIEIDNTLKSWAIPKGPSTDPADNRLAINTEDHPLDYLDFEGTIPEDQYGGGTVIVWDGGIYENILQQKVSDGKSMRESFDDGKIEVWLEGRKLKGGYVLIRTGKKGSKEWIFKKMKDDEADRRRNPVSTEPKSVLSGKTIKEMEKEMKAKE